MPVEHGLAMNTVSAASLHLADDEPEPSSRAARSPCRGSRRTLADERASMVLEGRATSRRATIQLPRTASSIIVPCYWT